MSLEQFALLAVAALFVALAFLVMLGVWLIRRGGSNVSVSLKGLGLSVNVATQSSKLSPLESKPTE